MSAREVLMWHREASYDAPDLDTGAPRSSAHLYARLAQDAAFAAEMTPSLLPIMYGGGYNVEHDTVKGTYSTTWSLRTYLYPTQAGLLLPWACTRINSGRTAPWTTTDSAGVMPIGDLASASFYRSVQRSDGSTLDRERIGGCKVSEWSLTTGREGDAWITSIEMSGLGKRILPNADDSSTAPGATEFPMPDDTDYPLSPYVFGHAATGTGTVKIGSERNATLMGLRVRCTNLMQPIFYASRFPSAVRWFGRELTIEADIKLLASPDDRAAWRAITAQDTEIILDTGAATVKFDLHANAYISNWQRNTPVDNEYFATLTVKNRHDSTDGTDLTITVS